MSSRRPHQRTVRAFTLLEVLIATLIFATVLTALNAVFYGALQLRSKTARVVEKAIPLNRVATFIKRDLQNIVPPGDGEVMAGPLISGTLPTAMEELGGLEIYTSTGITDDLQHPWGDLQRVGYYLRTPTNVIGSVGKDLVRLLSKNLLPTIEELPTEQRLLQGVERLQFYFWSGTETQWRDYWNSTNEETVLPKAIKVRMEFAEDPKLREARLPFELVVPIVSQKRTNSTESATGSTGTGTATNGGGGNTQPAAGGNNPGGGNNNNNNPGGGGAPPTTGRPPGGGGR